MLNLGTAASLLKSMKDYISNPMMLIDIDGVIMSSPDLSRRGKVHTLALELLGSTDDQLVVLPGDPCHIKGYEAGIYLVLNVNNARVGVLVVLDGDEALVPSANMARLYIEKSLELDLLRNTSFKSNEQHLHRLIYNSNISKEDLDYIVRIAHIKPDLPRVPIYFVVHHLYPDKPAVLYDSGLLKQHILSSDLYGADDLLCCTLDNTVIWFKAIRPEQVLHFLAERDVLTEQIETLMAPLVASSSTSEVVYSAYIGSVQNNLRNYSRAFRHCEWMRVDTCEKGIYYFHTYLFRYLSSKFSKAEYDSIFGALRDAIDESSENNFCEMMGALIQHDYNFARVAEMLYIHRNTAAYRFDKIRNLMGLNPLNDSNERIYLELLYNYYKIYPSNTSK